MLSGQTDGKVSTVTLAHALRVNYNYNKSDVHTCIHTYIHAYVHTCIHAYMHTYIHTCIHAYMHTYIHAYIHTYVRTYIHTYIHELELEASHLEMMLSRRCGHMFLYHRRGRVVVQECLDIIFPLKRATAGGIYRGLSDGGAITC